MTAPRRDPTADPPGGSYVREGTVLEAGGGVYRVALDEGSDGSDGSVVEASLRGRLKLEKRTGERVVVGDRVRVQVSEEGDATVEEVLERRTEIVRAGPGGRRPRIVAANVDRVLVVFAGARPEPRSELIDRFLVVAEAEGVEPVLVLNKVDLDEARAAAEKLVSSYRDVGYDALAVSAATGEGLDALGERLRGGISALLGPSGAGKSTLLNALRPGLGLRTGAVGRRRGSGRHTTVSARLIRLEGGGAVVDTPGFSEVGLWRVDPGLVDHCFPEFRALVDACRFRGCTHVHEPGCAVLAAVEEGAVSEKRHRSYRRLREEAEEAARPW